MDQLANALQKELAWAEPGQEGLGYQLERQKIQAGARAILADILYLKSAALPEKQEGMKRLYEQLHRQQINLQDLWTLSLGHRDTRTVIANALRQIDNTALIDDLPLSFRKEAREKALRQVYWDKLVKSMQRLDQPQSDQWQAIKTSILAIGQKDPGVYAFKQALAWLNQQKETAQQAIRSPLLKPLQTLIHHLTSTINTLNKKAPDLWSESNFIKTKERQLLNSLNSLEGVQVDALSLKAGHTGFKGYFELTLRAKINNSALAKTFVSYPGYTHTKLSQQLQTLHQQIQAQQLQEKHAALTNWLKQELPPFLHGQGSYLSTHECLNEDYGSAISEINALIKTLAEQAPPQINKHFDRQALDQLYQDKAELQKKISKEEREQGIFLIQGYRLQMKVLDGQIENHEAQRQQFENQKAKEQQALRIQLERPIRRALSEALEQLKNRMETHHLRVDKDLRQYHKKADELHRTLGKEEDKRTILSRRFDSIEELLAFETAITTTPDSPTTQIDSPRPSGP